MALSYVGSIHDKKRNKKTAETLLLILLSLFEMLGKQIKTNKKRNRILLTETDG